MQGFELVIANKNYSSWSFRPWIALTHKRIPFTETFVRFDFPAGNPAIKAVSPSGKVPLLKHGDVKVWESLAILEYAAEVYPEKDLWPSGVQARAKARSVSAEMAAGFGALRGACPMNMRRTPEKLTIDQAVKADVARIVHIWRECLDASGGPFLFGEFSIADAMYAPVVSRFGTYLLTEDAVADAYGATLRETPAWQSWEADALQEIWIVDEDEI